MAVSKTFSDFLHKHPFPVIFFDLKSKAITYANPSATRFFKQSASRLKALPLSGILRFSGKLQMKTPVPSVAQTGEGERPRVLVHARTLSQGVKKTGVLLVEPVGPGETQRVSDVYMEALAEMNQPVILFSDALEIQFANRAVTDKIGYTAEELYGLPLIELFRFPDEMALKALVNTLRQENATPLDLQIKFTCKSGTPFETEVYLRRLGDGPYFLMVITDVTRKLEVERKFQDTLREKEVLVREVHHRVKNSLQLISSMLYLKIAAVDRAETRVFLEDVREKIRAIALTHERLLQTENKGTVDVGYYLGNLVGEIQKTWRGAVLSVDVDTFFDHSYLKPDQAIMCGLIVNELMVNAFRHAFQGRDAGQLTVIFREHKGAFLLSVADDGVSLPTDIQPGTSQTFGMQLIDVCTRQLGGRLEVIRQPGTHVQIHF